jgi:hypothetical protein
MLYDEKAEQLRVAIEEAERFISKARVALKACEGEIASRYNSASLKEVSAAKRASMDLTRCLVFVRK